MSDELAGSDGRLPSIAPPSRWSQGLEVAADLLLVVAMIYTPPLVLGAIGMLTARLLRAM
jgi:hypothetical protein